MSQAFDRLVAIMDRLRDPGGCPWDREQTLDTLQGFLLEEAYEVVEAAQSGNGQDLCEELGDLLLQIVFMARIGRERSWFDVDQVCDRISEKLIRRHPHVFAEREVNGSGEVKRNWEEIKRAEKGSQTARSALDGVPTALPALLKAYRMTEKAAAVGFDWARPDDVIEKVREEVEELAVAVRHNGDQDGIRDEFGDVLFALANLARHLGLEPETALQGTNDKFQRRFRQVEAAAAASGRGMTEHSLEELDQYWDAAKRIESPES